VKNGRTRTGMAGASWKPFVQEDGLTGEKEMIYFPWEKSYGE
jgi:hypothetical protein